MKRLTVDQTWEQCLKMWKWISRQCKGKDTNWCETHIDYLKEEWLEKNGIKYNEISQDCFLCDRTTPKGDDWYECRKCPAKKIDRAFNCCEPDGFDDEDGAFFALYPRLFYAKLKELNKIRLAKK